MNEAPLLAPKYLCTGCGACQNACPNDAITMVPDRAGFLYPAIDAACNHCGICGDACPVLHPGQINNGLQSSFAMLGDDRIRMRTTAGGFAEYVASAILTAGGTVFSDAWQSDWSGTRKTPMSSVQAFTDFKFLQSSNGLAYRNVLELLEHGKIVLYIGTPCQVNGLYGFLGGKDHADLITLEFACAGLPSAQIFSEYLRQNFETSQIRAISFCDKAAFGWTDALHLYFNDGKEFHELAGANPYLSGTKKALFCREACGQCPFARLPRNADFTTGSLDRIGELYPLLNDGLGTSFVLVNNDRHQALIADIRAKVKFSQDLPPETIAGLVPSLQESQKPDTGRKHFFLSRGIKPFATLVKNSFRHYYDVGIVGLWYGKNYGSILTYFALYNLLRDLGKDAVMLPKPFELWDDSFNAPENIAQKFIWRHCNVFLPFASREAYAAVNDLCADFIVGSDVVWNYEICGKESGHLFFLDFVEPGHKKISFASSFGGRLTGPEKHQLIAAYHLNSLDGLSCREAASIEVLREICPNKEIAHVLDPVFLCNKTCYLDCIAQSEIQTGEAYCFSYLLNRAMREEKLELMALICRQKELKNVICCNPMAINNFVQAYGQDTIDHEISVEDWLKYMHDSQYYFGDSYHGMCFALIFHKPFLVVFGDNTETNSSLIRFSSLLASAGLEERLVRHALSPEKYIDLLNRQIDWEDVDARLGKFRQYSIEWLKTALDARAAPAKYRLIQALLASTR